MCHYWPRRVYDLRTEAGLSQRELAARVGTTASVICRLEDADYQGHSLALLRRGAAAGGGRGGARGGEAGGGPVRAGGPRRRAGPGPAGEAPPPAVEAVRVTPTWSRR